jgi:magnesium chelatase family protein
MSAKAYTTTLVGLNASIIEVEADIGSGLPAFNIVGLPDTAVKESRERVKAAIKNSGLAFPVSRLTVNLAPADLRKEGPHFDLPLALAVLEAQGLVKIPPKNLFIGELALDGQLRPVSGVLAMVLEARLRGYEKIYLPEENAPEAALVDGVMVLPAKNLLSVLKDISGAEALVPYIRQGAEAPVTTEYDVDFAYIKGQEHGKRALEIAAAGGHNCLLSGPPGTGKTLLAQALVSVLPKLTPDEALEVAKIWSVAGLLPAGQPLLRERPFRAPHHGASAVALVGGGANPKPGEITLAHRGVLFLDEIAEFGKSVLDQLRQPLEGKFVVVSRAAGTIRFPANFMLVAAKNPCPCGYYGDKQKPCQCGASQILKYKKKISGPLLDRIDIGVEVPRITYEKLTQNDGAENSAAVRARVSLARARQSQRLEKYGLMTNSEMSGKLTMEVCKINKESESLLKNAVNNDFLSARSLHRVLRVARTIADLADSEEIKLEYVSEALNYRPRVD